MNTSNNTDLTNDIIESIQDKKGGSITILDMSAIESAPAPKFIICQGRSTSQVSAIADSIREKKKKKYRLKPYNYDGYRNSQWVVLDYGSVMIHIFLPEFREFYNLEELWNDAQIINIPDID